MQTTYPAAVSVGVTPAVVTVAREPERDEYEARFTLTPNGDRWTEWLIITPRNPVHPHQNARHWLGDPLAGWHGPPDTFPSVVSCPVNVGGLNPDVEHRATVYVALRVRPDEVVTERFTVVLTKAQAVTAVAPGESFAALGTVVADSPARPAPSPLSAAPSVPPSPTSEPPPASDVGTLERFCPKCGRAFGETEKFCPKDGRLRQPKGSV